MSRRSFGGLAELSQEADAGFVDALPLGFFSVGEALCNGDSGSPAVDAHGAVVGIASSVDTPDISFPSGKAGDCVGANVRGVYADVAHERDLIAHAFSAAGAAPWLAGTPDPRAGLAPFEGACKADVECTSNVCVDGRCSHGCAAGCPAGYSCGQASGRLRCLIQPDAGAAAQQVASTSTRGCAAGGTAASWAALWPAALSFFLVLAGVRRVRRRQHD